MCPQLFQIHDSGKIWESFLSEPKEELLKNAFIRNFCTYQLKAKRLKISLGQENVNKNTVSVSS